MIENPDRSQPRLPKLWEALVPVAGLVAFISINIFRYGGDPQIPLIGGAALAALMGWRLGYKWSQIQEGIVKGIEVGLGAILILLVVGMLIATWIASGVVPILIYHGLKLLRPEIFLPGWFVICSIVSLATGSSWTTAGTVGIALIGVGRGLGLPLPMVAGAIVSGAYFGDKMSPLSDTTNLAPAVSGSELFEHIRHMTYTTLPALIIALVLYTVLGFVQQGTAASGQDIAILLATLEKKFNLNLLLLLPPVLVILMVFFKLPALPALLGGALLGAALAMIFQGTSFRAILVIMQTGYEGQTGNAVVDELLTRGGLESMLKTVLLIICALTFGGVMQCTGMLAAVAGAILNLAHSTGALVAATVATCIGMNIIAPDQYLSIVVPGRMYREAYLKRGLHPKNLSRTLEDAGTLSSPLVPWNTCGAFMGKTLGVYPLAYLPFAFLNLLCPIIAILIAFLGWKIAYTPLRADLSPALSENDV